MVLFDSEKPVWTTAGLFPQMVEGLDAPRPLGQFRGIDAVEPDFDSPFSWTPCGECVAVVDVDDGAVGEDRGGNSGSGEHRAPIRLK